MARPVPTVAAAQVATSTSVPALASFEDRWAAWQAKGAAHELAVRRKMAIAAPIVIVVLAALAYLISGR